MEAQDKTYERIDKLVKFLEEKGLVIATKEEILGWKPGSEVPEGKDNTPLPEPPSPQDLSVFTIPAEFVIITLAGDIIIARRIWNLEKQRWLWWRDLGDSWISMEENQIKYWFQLPPLPDDNSKPEENP